MSSAPSRSRASSASRNPFVSPLTVRLARTNEDLTRHGDESPAMAAAHRAAGKRRRCRNLVAAVAAMVGRRCSPSSRAHPLRDADRTPRTPTPSRSSPAATRNRSSSRLTAFLMHGVPSLAAPWRTAGSCGSGKHGDAPPSIAGSQSVGPPLIYSALAERPPTMTLCSRKRDPWTLGRRLPGSFSQGTLKS
jgi:hypothetical protein